MAAETGIPTVYLEHQLSHGRATKKTRGLVIERLRHKNSRSRSWTDSIKHVRSSVAERRAQIENTEPSSVKQCLDTLQKVMKVKSQQTLKERLDLIGRHLGLSTQIQDQRVSLGTDAFQVDVLLGDGGNITNVKLANQGDVVDCPDLKDVLKKGDFAEFIEHLQGFQSIYQVTSDEKLKSKAFLALQALEKDLNQLAQFQSSISGVANYIHKCPLGIMLPRLAGKPMKLIYFVSPYDLLDKKSLAAHPLTVEAITENFLGQSVTVCIEPVPDTSPANKLQTMPLMNVNKTQDGKSLPSFSAVSKINSMMLPARFVLTLPHSMPVSLQILQKITSQTNLEIHKEAHPQSLRSMIVESYSGGRIKDSRRLFVSLPDQQHIYFLDCLNGGSQEQQGLMVSRIPFTHPTHVPQILNLMRQQLLFNIVISSCVRPGARKESAANAIVFEVTATSLQQLTIVFEHPAHDSLIRVDIDLCDITSLKCRVVCTDSDQTLCSDEAISRVFHRCMSIPIMLRWLIGKGRGQLDRLKEEALAAERVHLEKVLFLKEMLQRQAKHQNAIPPTNRPPPQPPHPPPLPPPPSYSHLQTPMHQDLISLNGQANSVSAEVGTAMPGREEFVHTSENNIRQMADRILMSPDLEHDHNPLSTTFLDKEELSASRNQKDVHDSPMLSRLLDDNTSVATTVIPMNCKPNFIGPAKRQRKRRSQSEFNGPSPKHQNSVERFGSLGSSMELDMLPGLMDHSLHNSPNIVGHMTSVHSFPSRHHPHPLLNHTPKSSHSHNAVIDLTEDSSVGESSLKKLADSMDKHFIHKNLNADPDLNMLLNEADIQSRLPSILQNSSSDSKNENASTSLEVILKGSGEVGRAKDFDPSDASHVPSSTTFSKLSSLLLTDCPPHLSISPHKANSVFFSEKLGSDELFAVNVCKSVTRSIFVQDVKMSPASLAKGILCQNSNFELPSEKSSITGIFEKFDISRQQKNVKCEVISNEIVKSQPADCKVSLRLKVGPLKQQNNIKHLVKSCHSVDEITSACKSSIGTFDFKSDEDDDDPLVHFSSDRCLHSSSPPHLHISGKHKQLNDYACIPHKSDKTKRKDRSSGNTTKRKREKDESKREKKRKKNEHFIKESVYRTVVNDTEADFKFKIRVAKKPPSDISETFSHGKVPDYEITKKPLINLNDKVLGENKNCWSNVDDKVKEKDSGSTGSNSKKSLSTKMTSTPIQKISSSKSGGCKPALGSNTGNKTDPKLVTKATIRLKPVTIPNSGSTINISQSGPKVSTATPTNSKTDRRNSTSLASPVLDKRPSAHNAQLDRRNSIPTLLDRRIPAQPSTTSSASVTVTTSATTNLSLSSILPNAPTISEMASLPRIPKRPSTASSTSLNRTSSLEPASGSGSVSVGTKTNNSYTVGLAGRFNPDAAPIRGRPSSASSGAYSGRHTSPGNGANRNNLSAFSAGSKSGSVQDQTGPLVNSGQSASGRALGQRMHNLSASGVCHKGGNSSTHNHKHSGSLISNTVRSSSSNSSVPQKTVGGDNKLNSISSKMGNHFVGHKHGTSISNSLNGQKHGIQNSASGNNTRTSSSSSVSGSTNTSGLSKSPNITNSNKSCINGATKSPTVSAANKSPNLSSSNSGPSPNISRSPSVGSSAVKLSSHSSCGKSSIADSHKHLPSVSRNSSVNKSNNKTQHFSSKSHTPTSSSTSFTVVKAGTKGAPSSDREQQSGITLLSVADSSSTNPSSVLSQLEESLEAYPDHKSAGVLTPSSPPLLPTIKGSSSDQEQTNKGSISDVAEEPLNQHVPDKHLASPVPSTLLSADSKKSKFNFLSSRGRKNSLSAIVDKLKHNAVGSGFDLPLANNQIAAGSKIVNPEDKISTVVSSDVANPGQRQVCSQNSAVYDSTLSGENVQSKANHFLDSDHVKVIFEENNDKSKGSPVHFSAKFFQSEPGISKKFRSKTNSADDNGEKCQSVSRVKEGKCELDLLGWQNYSGKDGSLSETKEFMPHINNVKEKTIPQAISLQQQIISSVQEFTNGCSTSALILSAPSVKSVSSTQDSSTVVSRQNQSQQITSEPAFRMPSIKLVDGHNESKNSEVICSCSEFRKSKLHSGGCSQAADVGERGTESEKSLGNRNSSKILMSPLSDISSPENGLIIDNEDPSHFSAKTLSKLQSSTSVKVETGNSINLCTQERSASPIILLDCALITSSPRTSRPAVSRSSSQTKISSGISTPKGSDSPCFIDDELMDVALGFGS